MRAAPRPDERLVVMREIGLLKDREGQTLWRVTTVHDEHSKVPRLLVAVAVDPKPDGTRDVVVAQPWWTLTLHPNGELTSSRGASGWPEDAKPEFAELVRLVVRDASGHDPVPVVEPGRQQPGGSA